MGAHARANKGQMSLPEYTVTFFLVIAVVVAMTSFIQRSLQARIHDAHKYMVDTAIASCDTNCLNATGNRISYEYEPYYGHVESTTSRVEDARVGLGAAGTRGGSGISYKRTSQSSASDSTSMQLPPKDAK